MLAAMYSKTVELIKYLKETLNIPDSQNIIGQNILHYAVINTTPAAIDIIQYCVKKNRKLLFETSTETPLEFAIKYACNNEIIDTVRDLMEEKSVLPHEQCVRMFKCISLNKHTNKVELANYFMSSASSSIIQFIYNYTTIELIELLLKRDCEDIAHPITGDTALLLECRTGTPDIGIIDLLLKYATDLDDYVNKKTTYGIDVFSGLIDHRKVELFEIFNKLYAYANKEMKQTILKNHSHYFQPEAKMNILKLLAADDDIKVDQTFINTILEYKVVIVREQLLELFLPKAENIDKYTTISTLANRSNLNTNRCIQIILKSMETFTPELVLFDYDRESKQLRIHNMWLNMKLESVTATLKRKHQSDDDERAIKKLNNNLE
jgi:hypothetical protein